MEPDMITDVWAYYVCGCFFIVCAVWFERGRLINAIARLKHKPEPYPSFEFFSKQHFRVFLCLFLSIACFKRAGELHAKQQQQQQEQQQIERSQDKVNAWLLKNHITPP